MSLLQVPPLPPTPPPEAVVISGGPPEAVFIAAVIVTGFIVLGIVLFPLARALARRLEGRGAAVGTDPMLLERVADLEHRLAEAEERIDFNERMLSQREPLALPRDKAD